MGNKMTSQGIITYLKLRYKNIKPYSHEWVDELIEDAEANGAAGKYRACFVYPSEKVVIKVPLSQAGLACCEDELRIFNMAQKEGLGHFFAEPIEKIELFENVYAYKYEFVCGKTLKHIYCEDILYCLSTKNKVNNKGRVYQKLLDFLDNNNISDLHEQDWKITEHHIPKIMDYGWF